MKDNRDGKHQKKEGKVMITLKNIGKSFGEKVVLKNINLSVFEREFIALVGQNGSGKSTLLKILANLLEPDEGKVDCFSELQIAYFPQEISLKDQNKTGRELLSELMGVDPNKIAGRIGLSCKKLRFPVEKLDSKIMTLSGGEKSKLMLMLILNSPADIFLLDEPTNNLDLRGLILLENFILANRHGFLVVSHDRKFLDRLTVGVIEINKTHNIDVFHHATYTSYLKEKKSREKKEMESYEDFQREKKRLEESARKKKEKASKMARGPKKRLDNDKHIVGFKKDRAKRVASQASSMEKRSGRLTEVKKPKSQLPLNLRFQFSERSGDVVFGLSEVEVEQKKFHLGPINLEINFEDRVVLIGPNGEGKSTLLKLLLGELSSSNGVFQMGSRVKIGYLPQETRFNDKETVLEYFLKTVELEQSNSRKILKRFGFSADDMSASCQDLSPGEKSRLVLATLMAKDVNCLILDEPSNHLDPEALDRIMESLKEFPGTIIIVSHDRYLIDQIGITKTYLMENGKISALRDYHEYEENVLLDSGDTKSTV